MGNTHTCTWKQCILRSLMWDTVYLQNHMKDFLNITVNTTKEKLPKCKLTDKLSGSFKMPCVWETSQNLSSNPKSFRPLFHELLCLLKTCKWSSVLHYKIQEQFNLRCNIQFWKLSLKHRYLGLIPVVSVRRRYYYLYVVNPFSPRPCYGDIITCIFSLYVIIRMKSLSQNFCMVMLISQELTTRTWNVLCDFLFYGHY